MGAIIVTLGIGTCSTNGRSDDGFASVNRRSDDTNQRSDDTNQRSDEVQSDIREIRTLLFEPLKALNPAD